MLIDTRVQSRGRLYSITEFPKTVFKWFAKKTAKKYVLSFHLKKVCDFQSSFHVNHSYIHVLKLIYIEVCPFALHSSTKSELLHFRKKSLLYLDKDCYKMYPTLITQIYSVVWRLLTQHFVEPQWYYILRICSPAGAIIFFKTTLTFI